MPLNLALASSAMNCRLCGGPGPVRKSHIIPEFAYRPLYDEINRMHVLTSQEGEKNRIIQKGEREKLLCDSCENLLSKNERYVSLVFSGQLPVRVSGHSKLVQVQGIDYAKFKLFALSVLWRAAVAEHDTFAQVKLGAHEEKLRAMILDENPGSIGTYPFLLSPIVGTEVDMAGMIVQPTWCRIAGHYAYRFVFLGLVWVFIVSNHRLPKVILDCVINEAGSLNMVPSQFWNLGFLIKLASDLEKKGKLS